MNKDIERLEESFLQLENLINSIKIGKVNPLLKYNMDYLLEELKDIQEKIDLVQVNKEIEDAPHS